MCTIKNNGTKRKGLEVANTLIKNKLKLNYEYENNSNDGICISIKREYNN